VRKGWQRQDRQSDAAGSDSHRAQFTWDLSAVQGSKTEGPRRPELGEGRLRAEHESAARVALLLLGNRTGRRDAAEFSRLQKPKLAAFVHSNWAAERSRAATGPAGVVQIIHP
jgi:hypothetical protein